MISLKIGGIIVAAFIAGAFVASPELRAYAANTIGSSDIIDESILSQDIKNGEVKSADLGTSAVTNSKIASSAVTNSKIGSSAVTSSKIATGGVTNSDIAANAVTGDKIVDGTIGYADVSRALIAVEHRDDCNCGGTGWDPSGTLAAAEIYDNRITPNSVVSVSLAGGFNVPIACWAEVSDAPGHAQVRCDDFIPNGYGVNYAIFTNPAYN